MVSLSNSAASDQYIAVGIIGGFAGIRVAPNAAHVDEVGTTAIAAGDWAFIEAEFISDVDRKIYLNGVLEASFTTSRDVDTQVLASADTLGVNRIFGPTTDFAGSYQLFWGVDAALSAEHHAVIHRETQHFSWRALTVADGAVAQWLLDEPTDLVSDVYRDQFNHDYNAVPTSTGVTQGVIGILPSAPGLAADFNGANGGIDTNWLGYPAGATERIFEVWLEAGFVGTVLSMGANTDANALVISIDGSGDVVINIRGAGNARTYTGTFDVAGDANHLWVELPTAGDSLHDFDVYENGVALAVGTAGTDTTLATTATLDLHIGEDVTDLATADGNGIIYGVTVYDAEVDNAAQVLLHDTAGRAVLEGVHS
jgi:hypothetical protein